MVQIDLPMSLAFGATLAIATAPRIAGDPDERRRVFLCGLTVQSLVLTPLVLLYLARFPGWDTMYFMASAVPPPWLVFFVAAGSVACFLIGYALAAHWVADADHLKAYLLALVAWGAVGLIPLVLWNRFVHVGTYEAYHAGQDMPLIFFHLGYMATTIFAGAALAVALFLMARAIVRGGGHA